MRDYEEERNKMDDTIDDTDCYIEDDTEDFSSSDLSSATSSVEADNKGGIGKADSFSTAGTGSTSWFHTIASSYLPAPISQRLNQCSKKSLERCMFITMGTVGVIIILSGVLSATVGAKNRGAASSSSTSMRQNASDDIMWPFEMATNVSTTEEATTAVPSVELVVVTDAYFLGPTSRPSLRPSSSAANSTTITATEPSSPAFVPGNAVPTTNSAPTKPTPAQSPIPQAPSSAPPNTITYNPGNLTHMEHGLLLSQGLRARIIAQSGSHIRYRSGQNSSRTFHHRPDAGATFAEIRPSNQGGWVYVSNSEMRAQDAPFGNNNGGVGAITFDKHGNSLKYEMLLENTTWNCGGGKTPWNTWVSCEENPKTGQLYQVSPFGLREPEILTLGKDGGRFESFAHDVRNRLEPHFYVTEDHQKGALQRFTPAIADWTNPWALLHGNGTTSYLILKPNKKRNGGTFRWSSNKDAARSNAKRFYPNSEGIDTHDGSLFFVSKIFRQLYELDLDKLTYVNKTTRSGIFDGAPDQLVRIMRDKRDEKSSELDDILYFTEEDGKDAGVHGRNKNGKFFSILESPIYHDEVTGLAFSPDNMHMYLAYQVNGLLFDVYREDGYPFHAKSINVKFHNT